jgi:hydrogenase maturation protease
MVQEIRRRLKSETRKNMVIGYGNSLRRDDGIGVIAAQQLSETFPADTVTVVSFRQLMPELAEDLANANVVVFIDASIGDPAGRIAVTPLEFRDAAAEGLTHHFAPSTLLELAERLYGRRPQAFLVSVCGQSFDLGEGLTSSVAAALPQVMHEVQRLIG